jgi:E3 ubiquitin-protein ligase HUWE1
LGFYEILDYKNIRIFNEKELELLICGLPDIDVDDWRNNTEYYGYTSTSVVIQWFWRAVRSFKNEDRARLLQFVTGTSKLPMDGF